MKYALVICLSLIAIARSAAAEPAAGAVPAMNVIPSWGDMTLVYGPGTDAAMDTEQAMENMVKHWKGRGFTGVYLRTDLSQFPPGSIIRHERKTQPQPTLAVFWHLVDEILERCDPHKAARKASEKLGFEYWMWHPHIYSEGAPVDAGVPGPGRMVPWGYAHRYFHEHPEAITVDRAGNKQWMVPEYAYPGARAEKAAEFAWMAKTYRPTGIIASMRSETSQLIPPPEHADQYGFNQIVVDEMKKLYDVDILTDSRFDWKSPQFKSDDPMVQKWRELRGSHITQLYREIRQAMREADPKVQLAIVLSGEYVGPLMGNAKLEWRKWVDEGIADVIVMPVTFEATLDLESTNKGYLTDVRAGKGLVTVAEVKQYILKSKHPQIKVIQTGASSYFYEPPPEGADGWQCDVWYDSYHVAWYQRWQQWMKDLAEQGAIRFIEQDFDSFEPKGTGAGGGIGDGRYHPELSLCPGVWYTMGDGSDARPYVQQEVRRGGSGAAIALTGKELTGLHHASPDRSLLTGMLDLAIVNGKSALSCWVYRQTDKTSLTVYFTGSAHHERDVALRIAPTGKVSYADGKKWVETQVTVPVQRWTQMTIELDADAQRYFAYVGDKRSQVCGGIAIAPPEDRFVAEHGVNLPIKVPAYRIFNTVNFVPAEGSKDAVYLDDVQVKWLPTLHYAKPGKRVLLDESFEDAKPGAGDPGGSNFTAKKFVIEKTTSYGPGALCLRATGGGEFRSDLGQQLTAASAKGTITLDLDVYVRSDKSFPYILPDPTTRSDHSTVIALEGPAPAEPLAAIDTAGGTWKLWDGKQFVDTGKFVTYDVWSHVQIAVDPASRTYRLIVQPVGELPTEMGQAACSTAVKPNEKLKLTIRPSDTKDHTSCYDNIRVTSN